MYVGNYSLSLPAALKKALQQLVFYLSLEHITFTLSKIHFSEFGATILFLV